MTDRKPYFLLFPFDRDRIKAIAQTALQSALASNTEPGVLDVFCTFDDSGAMDYPPEIVGGGTIPVSKLETGVVVNTADLPSGTKAGEAMFVGSIQTSPTDNWSFHSGPIRL